MDSLRMQQRKEFHDIVSKGGTGCQVVIEGSTVSATTPAEQSPAVEPDADQ